MGSVMRCSNGWAYIHYLFMWRIDSYYITTYSPNKCINKKGKKDIKCVLPLFMVWFKSMLALCMLCFASNEMKCKRTEIVSINSMLCNSV